MGIEAPEPAVFARIDDLIASIHTYQTAELAKDIETRTNWVPNYDRPDSQVLEICIHLVAYSRQAQAEKVGLLVARGEFDVVFGDYATENVAALEPVDLAERHWNRLKPIRFKKKIRAMVDVGKAFLLMAKQAGSFMNQVRSCTIPDELSSGEDIDRFWSAFDGLQIRLRQAGMPFFDKQTLLCHLLMALGFPVVKPDSVLMKAADDLGILSVSSHSDSTRRHVIQTLQAYCVARGLPVSVIDVHLLTAGWQTGAKQLVRANYCC